MGKITRGLAKIEMGDVAADGGPGTDLDPLSKTDRDSPITMVEADPTIDRLFSHEDDDPLDTEVTGGEKPFLFTIVDPDLATFARIFGGTVTGAGDAATWGMPSNKAIKNQTVKAYPKKGLITTIVNGSVYGKINHDMSKAGKLAIDVVVEPLKPTKAATPSIIYGPDVNYVAP